MIKDHNVLLEDSTLFHYTQYIIVRSNSGNMQRSGCRKGNVVSATLESERQEELLMLTQETLESTAQYTIRDQWDLLGGGVKKD